jgi:hypothetical protein
MYPSSYQRIAAKKTRFAQMMQEMLASKDDK